MHKAKLEEIEAAAELLSPEEKQELMLFPAGCARKQAQSTAEPCQKLAGGCSAAETPGPVCNA